MSSKRYMVEVSEGSGIAGKLIVAIVLFVIVCCLVRSAGGSSPATPISEPAHFSHVSAPVVSAPVKVSHGGTYKPAKPAPVSHNAH